MRALLSPRSVALVGASDDPAKTASRPQRFLRAAGYAGRVFPVARRATVLGEPAFASLDALPERPDHAFILLPTEGAMAAVADCVRLGIPAVTVLAGGFAESGPQGAAREDALRALLRGSGTRLLGPNSIGLANLHEGLVLTANAAFAEAPLPRGGLFVASQSGSMIGALMSRGKARGLGFSSLVSVGAEVDLDVGAVALAALEDGRSEAVLLFLETLRGADSLRGFAREAARRGVPVAAYKLGRSAEAAELAQSHTGALAGEDDLAGAFLADCGIARVETLEGLLEAPALLRRLPIRPLRRAPRVGVVTTTGGGAAMVVDQLGVRGVTTEAPSAATRAALAAAGIAAEGRILDLTLAGTRPAVMRAALDTLLAAPEFDLVVAVAGSSARFEPELAVQPVAEAAAAAPHLAAFCVPEAPEALARLGAAGVPAFRTPEAAADAIAAAFRRRPPRAAAPPAAAPGEGRLLDERAGYALLGLPHPPCAVLGEGPPPPFPVAAKALHAAILHKTDIGGVALGLRDAAALEAAAARIRASVARHRPELGEVPILVQAMAAGGLGEVLLGFRRDPQVGPVILLAAGGTLAEVLRDRAVRMAPVEPADAREMLAEVRAFRALEGHRGAPRGDLEALVAAVVAMSRLAARPEVLEAEVNPLLVLEEGRGVLALDAVVRVAAP
ncbi:acetate--CoA ligase family protein [Roseococcus sp. DSY-14]|uniref:acetate--CoA ligase family protein n=1 Tax=Roseococcus sp. DSY-14 TaxID=3369650 RepID=UPI00387AF767